MKVKNLKLLSLSLQDTLTRVNEILADRENGVTVLSQVDEGGYTEGYEHLESLLIGSKVDEDGDLLIQIKIEKLEFTY